MFANRCYSFFFFFYFLPDIDWQLPFHMQKPFITPLCLATSDNETDKNFNEGKKGNLQPPLSFPQVSKDDRSDIESSSDEDDSPPPNQKHHTSATNGTNKSHGTNGYLIGAPYPDEHWYHKSGATLQTPSILLCVRAYERVWERVCVVGTWTTSPVWKFWIDLAKCSFVIDSSLISFDSLLSSSIYLHQTALSEISKHSYWYNPLSV